MQKRIQRDGVSHARLRRLCLFVAPRHPELTRFNQIREVFDVYEETVCFVREIVCMQGGVQFQGGVQELECPFSV